MYIGADVDSLEKLHTRYHTERTAGGRGAQKCFTGGLSDDAAKHSNGTGTNRTSGSFVSTTFIRTWVQLHKDSY